MVGAARPLLLILLAFNAKATPVIWTGRSGQLGKYLGTAERLIKIHTTTTTTTTAAAAAAAAAADTTTTT